MIMTSADIWGIWACICVWLSLTHVHTIVSNDLKLNTCSSVKLLATKLLCLSAECWSSCTVTGSTPPPCQSFMCHRHWNCSGWGGYGRCTSQIINIYELYAICITISVIQFHCCSAAIIIACVIPEIGL